MRKIPKVILLPEQMSRELEVFSLSKGISQSEVIRMALFDFFEKRGFGDDGGNRE